jgi:diguanylate cyclase (GGDEF)-like protein
MPGRRPWRIALLPRSLQPTPFAPPRRWPWLLLAAAVAASAFFAILALHDRQQDARAAEQRASLFASELRDRVTHTESFAARLAPGAARSAILPVIQATVRNGRRRVDALATEVDDPRVKDLQTQLELIGRLAAQPGVSAATAVRLRLAADQMTATADAIATTQRRRATAVTRTTVSGSALLLLLAVALVATILQRSHRLVLRASRRHAETMLELAEHDPLTGLPNRRRLADDLDDAGACATRERPVQVLVCDLDGFKQLNDTLGHEAGDEELTRFADRLAAAVAPDATTYRLGGDEFCVVSSPGYDVEAAVRAVVDASAAAGTLRASVGSALLPTEATTPRVAMRLADERMYAAKAHARQAVA